VVCFETRAQAFRFPEEYCDETIVKYHESVSAGALFAVDRGCRHGANANCDSAGEPTAGQRAADTANCATFRPTAGAPGATRNGGRARDATNDTTDDN